MLCRGPALGDAYPLPHRANMHPAGGIGDG
jgi:hypothetical protein